jgi:hypothetical protein
MRSLKRLLLLVIVAFTVYAFAADAVVKRSVNLREQATSTSKKLDLLVPGDELELVEPNATNGYLHVRTDDGMEGWVWSRNVRVTTADAETLGLTGATVANTISPDWDKPTPKQSTFNGPDGPCPWNGDDSDPDTFVRKNRSDSPASPHDVSWQAIHDLEYPVAKPLRKNWTPEQLADIAKFEGIPVRTIGYLVAAKPQNRGHGEGTNCHFHAATDTDTHLALVGSAGDAEKNSVVIEFTPRFLKAHPNWTALKLKHWVDADQPVRITGWLMLDPDHRNHLNKFRATLWEIHPITKIEVSKDGAWVDFDTVK